MSYMVKEEGKEKKRYVSALRNISMSLITCIDRKINKMEQIQAKTKLEK